MLHKFYQVVDYTCCVFRDDNKISLYQLLLLLLVCRFSRPLLDFAATMTVLIMVVGIVGNLLTIVALIRCPRVRNVAAAFIIRLAMFCCFLYVKRRSCILLIYKNVFRTIYKSLEINKGK